MSDEGHVFESIPAYALDILEESETAQVAKHLAGCELCRSELRAYQQVVDELPLAGAEFQPPAGLKDRILQQARQSKTTAPPEAHASWWQKLRESFVFKAPAWGAVSLLLILVLGASNLFLWQRLSNLETASRDRLATVPLAGTDNAPGATGLMVISRDGKHGSLVVDGLPILDDTQQYQLWLIKDGERTSGGVFSVYAEGYGVLRIQAPEPLVDYQMVGITIEPQGGSPGPTGDKVMGGEL